jgi:hypothetical protein
MHAHLNARQHVRTAHLMIINGVATTARTRDTLCRPPRRDRRPPCDRLAVWRASEAQRGFKSERTHRWACRYRGSRPCRRVTMAQASQPIPGTRQGPAHQHLRVIGNHSPLVCRPDISDPLPGKTHDAEAFRDLQLDHHFNESNAFADTGICRVRRHHTVQEASRRRAARMA